MEKYTHFLTIKKHFFIYEGFVLLLFVLLNEQKNSAYNGVSDAK